MPFLTGNAYKPNELEQKVIEHWRTTKAFQESIHHRSTANPFIFLEGPPTANGMPHAGHVLTRTLKDVVGRYQTMRGHRVERKAGWDCHGLPVEIEVEKELGLKNKGDIETYGVGPFNQKCRESVFRYKAEWERMCERLGQWIDFEHPYVTLENDYIESVWWSLKKAWEKGLLDKGHRVTPHCPRCDTALSSHEVNLGYREVEEPSVFVKFRLVGKKDEFILAWTTTPWTLPGNVALAVGKEIEYVRVRSKDPAAPKETYLLAKECMGVLRGEHEILETLPGASLVGAAYEPLFPFLKEHLLKEFDIVKDLPGPDRKGRHWGPAWHVVAADFVTTQDGTGIVHTAKMYGEDDYNLGVALNIPAIHTVRTNGTFEPFVTPYAGQFVKDADPNIIEDLRAKGLLYRVKVHAHDYPFCWRCQTPLLYYARDSWFIRMSQLRDKLVAHNNTVNWVPAHVRDGRFGEFIRNVRDWALSRDRYWGTPLPVWTCTKNPAHQHCVGSLEELRAMADDATKKLLAVPGLDLHKPFVDDLHLVCPHCRARMDRETSVIDTWYDSGAAQYAQWNHPKNPENASRVAAPVDFITEGIDQTRGWFYTLLAESTFLFDRPSYKNCVVMGLILDEKGAKMSKSKKNYTDPNLIFEEYGADSMRWYLLSSSAITADKRFFAAAVREVYTRFFLTLWNTYQFFRSYAELDHWTPEAKRPDAAKRSLLDRWLLARLATVSRIAREEADAYNVHKATQAIEGFLVDDLSNWWLRRSRRRFWGDDSSADKDAAYATLHDALRGVITLAAPFAPFLTEALFQDLRAKGDPASVHHLNYPMGAATAEETELEREMRQIRALTESARSLRSKSGIKTRIPLRKATIVRNAAVSTTFRELLPILEEEANVKGVVLASTAAGLEDHEARIQQGPVGKELKQDAKAVLAAAREADPRQLGRQLVSQGRTTLAGKTLDKSYFLITAVAAPGTLKGDVGPDSIFLDAVLTPELESEGWAREVTRRIQEMRKEARLALQDRIRCGLEASPPVLAFLKGWVKQVGEETRADEVVLGRAPPAALLRKDWDIEGEKVTITLERVRP